MKKFLMISLILFLIMFTALIKNSTKKIEDEIFAGEEKLISLKKELQEVKLEYDYLSSSEKLLEFQDLYFDDLLVRKEIEEMKIINKKFKEININKFNFSK